MTHLGMWTYRRDPKTGKLIRVAKTRVHYETVQTKDYDATDDFARSIEEAYRVIRERKQNGGPGWGGWE